jgi:hypothetical protein
VIEIDKNLVVRVGGADASFSLLRNEVDSPQCVVFVTNKDHTIIKEIGTEKLLIVLPIVVYVVTKFDDA